MSLYKDLSMCHVPMDWFMPSAALKFVSRPKCATSKQIRMWIKLLQSS